MATGNQAAIAALNRLVAACKDGESGYSTAAKKADGHEQIKAMFRSHMEKRAQFAVDLLDEVHRLDTVAERNRTAPGVMHQQWMALEAILPRHRLAALIAECERGDRFALNRYEVALKQPMPAETRALLQKQCEEVRQAHQSMCRLKALATMNDLITTCTNAANGYERAGTDVANPELKELCQALAKQRSEFRSELLDAARKLGDGEPAHGTFGASLHRGWMKVAAVATRGRPEGVVKECLRGEYLALKHYDRALRQPLPENIRDLVLHQQHKILEAQAHLRAVPRGTAKTQA